MNKKLQEIIKLEETKTTFKVKSHQKDQILDKATKLISIQVKFSTDIIILI
jgi:hypothetical protein